jgi:Tol biopolymer transport system component
MGAQTGYLTGTTLGRFRIGPLVGRGGMGEVYRAEDAELGRAVALKVLPESLLGDPDRLARFIQEARTASSLNHPHIVAIYDIGRQAPDGAQGGARPVQYVAMELVAGVSLREAIDGRRFDLKRALGYLAQAADALAAAHAAGIVHRDLKPENLMVADAGYVKVLDFGLAKLQGQPAGPESTDATVSAGTSPGLVMGTVGYMSPEQAQGRAVDQRSDIFSFGCILYETVTGSRAFSGDSVVDTLHRIIHDQPEPITVRLPSAPPELQRIVRKCLAKDPEDRYQSMKEVAIDLRDLRRQLDSGAITMTPPAAAPRSPLLPIAIASAALAIAAATLVYWLSHRGGSAGPPQASISRVTMSGNVIDAAISPDGKYLAYVESSEGKQGLWYKQINGSRPLELVPGDRVGYWGIAFSRDGTSIYYGTKSTGETLGTMFEIPVLGGTPRRVLTGLDSAASFSPDGSRLVYLRAVYPDGNSSSLMMANTDGSNVHALASVRTPDLLAPGFFIAPSWSPDGTRISATIRNTQTRETRLVVIDAASGAITDLPGRYTSATFTEWLPDGSGIVFVAAGKDDGVPGPGAQLMLQPYPAGAARRITSGLVDYRTGHVTADGRSMLAVGFDATISLWTAPLADPNAVQKLPSLLGDGRYGVVWSGNGQRIFFGGMEGERRRISSIARDGSDRRELAVDGQALWPGPAPDGSFITFFGNRGGRFALWRTAADGSDARLLAEESSATYETLSPDGKWLYYTSASSGTPSTWRVPTDGSAKQTLVVSGLDRATVSPDGTRIVGIYAPRPDAPYVLAVLPADGGAVLQQFPGFDQAANSGTIAWAPDGTSVLYTSVERTNVWRQPLAGGPPQKITSYPDLMIFRFAVSRDGQLVLARGTQTRDAVLITNFR